MSIAKGTFSLTCLKCGKQHDFLASDSDVNPQFGSESQMDAETGYVWEHTFNCDNENCDNEIEINYEVWEYPEGVFNMDQIDIKGGKEVSMFDYDFHGEPDFED